MIRRFFADEKAATVVEYGLILAVLSLVVVIGFGTVTDALTFLWSNNNSRLVQAIQTDQ